MTKMEVNTIGRIDKNVTEILTVMRGVNGVGGCLRQQQEHAKDIACLNRAKWLLVGIALATGGLSGAIVKWL